MRVLHSDLSCWSVSSSLGMARALNTPLALCSSLLSLLLKRDSLELCSWEEGMTEELEELSEVFSGVEAPWLSRAKPMW